MAKNILCIPDTQAPFHHPDTIPFLKAVKAKYKCDEVVHLGDECDFHGLSDYTQDPDGMSIGQELEEALIFMRELYKAFPKVKACTSNHTSRPFRKAYNSGFSKKFIKDYHDFLEAPSGWKWADYWVVDGIRFEHGESYGGKHPALRHAEANMQSTVIGHHHSKAGVSYVQTPRELIFGLSVGCLIDDTAYAFRYNKKQKERPILGCGVIIQGVPYFIPMITTRSGRWNKKVY